jgi:D-3-phosphoglycerate dehydrogenase / 2-oxoglutarate reductase
MAKVLISDKMSPTAQRIFEENGIEVDVRTNLTPEELLDIIDDYDGLAVRSSTRVTAKLLNAAGKLRVVGRAGIGVDNIDMQAASQKGVIVMNTPFGNTVTTAEHAITLMVSAARMVPQATASMKAGKWEKSRFMGIEINNKTLGVIGTGNVGSLVIERAHGLGMQVIAYDPYISNKRADDLGVELVELDELYARADFITVHTPMTRATRRMLDNNAFEKMKQGVIIINAARGGIVDEQALDAALESGKVRAAALDVFEDEPVQGHKLMRHERFICTPHLGASTVEAQERVAEQVARQISDYLNRSVIQNALNIPSVAEDEMHLLQPYLNLGERLGSILGQISDGGMKRLEIEYAGQVSGYHHKPITTTILKGLLNPILQDSVNLVNAPLLAEQRNIDIVETTRQMAGELTSRIQVRLVTEAREWVVEGTTVNGLPRVVGLNGIEVDFVPQGRLLFMTNWDLPGLIGRIGTVLGDAGINIAGFQLGRKEPGGSVISFISIDDEVPDSLLEQLAATEHVKSVRQIEL